MVFLNNLRNSFEYTITSHNVYYVKPLIDAIGPIMPLLIPLFLALWVLRPRHNQQKTDGK